MSCCGSGRRAASTPTSLPAGGGATRHAGVRPLRYTGPTALTVLGPASGRVYRFAAPGASLTVDPRDWAALSRLDALQPG